MNHKAEAPRLGSPGTVFRATNSRLDHTAHKGNQDTNAVKPEPPKDFKEKKDFKSKRAEMRKKYNEELKAIFTPEQYNAYKADMKKMRKAHKAHRKEMKKHFS